MIGSRVVINGEVGIVEEVDDDGLVKVRLMTPHNTPSCCSTWCDPCHLSDGTNVIPQPRSKAWYREAALFFQGVAAALQHS